MSTVLLLLLAACVRAITFDLPYGQQKCFGEDFHPRTTVKGDVHVSTGRGGADMKLDVYVTNAAGVVAFHRADVNTVKFSFTTGEYDSRSTQPYRVCVLHQVSQHSAHPPAGTVYRRITLTLEPTRTAADTATLATRSHADRTSQSFHDVSLSVDRLIESMDEIRMREQTLTDIGRDTTSIIVRISVVACMFTLLTGVLNFMFLKDFFKRKKMV